MQEDWWHPEGQQEPHDWDDANGRSLGAYEQTEDRFHIGQCYDEEPAKVLKCRLCGGRHFEVAEGSYFTAIKCVKCLWEACVHSG